MNVLDTQVSATILAMCPVSLLWSSSGLALPQGKGLKVMLLMGAWSQELASLLPAAGPRDSGILQLDDSEACLEPWERDPQSQCGQS